MARRVLPQEYQDKANSALKDLDVFISANFPPEQQAEEHVNYLKAISEEFAKQSGPEALLLSIFFRKQARAMESFNADE